MRQLLKAALVGILGGVLFVFLFPKGAISTLVHDVLDLPGPGAGIAIPKGPVAILFALVAVSWARVRGAGLVSILSYALLVVLAVQLLKIPMNPKGMFGGFWFCLAFVLLGGFIELLWWLTTGWKPVWRNLVTAAGANLFLLVVYWLIVFPRSAGWVAVGDVPVLLMVCLTGGLFAGLLAWVISRVI